MKFRRNYQRNLRAAGLFFFLIAMASMLLSSATSLASPVVFAVLMAPAVAPNSLPVGTILPIALEHELSVDQAIAGRTIEAHLMQAVPLSKHDKIRLKSQVTGTIVSVTKSAEGNSTQLTLRFNKIEYRSSMIPIATSLRAMASFEAVRNAQMSFAGADSGTPTGWANTVQIGGDIRFGDGGEVRNRHKQAVGKGVIGGVLVHVRAQPGSACEGPVNGDDSLQALWVFSSDACGVYNLRGVQITETGRSEPLGAITLTFEKSSMRLNAGTAILLRVLAPQ